MESVKLSSNYQIVVPQSVRRKLGLEKGQLLYVKSVEGQEITLTAQNPASRYFGALKGAWSDDPIAFQRDLRQGMERRI